MPSVAAPATPGLTGLSTLLPVLERAALLALAVPVLAAWGCFKARRVFQMQERMYQSMLLAGARVPTQAPVMQPADHWPMLLVGLTVTVIAGFVLSLMWAAGTGRL